MSSLGIFDKETKTYKKVADLSKPAVIDSSMSDTSTNTVQNKVVKSYVDTRTTLDTSMSDSSTKAVQNKVVKKYVDDRTNSVAWNNITGKPSTYTPSSHTHTKSQITDFPSSLPANGGNSATVNGHTVNSDVPSGAKFTDTTYNDATTSAHGLMTPAMVSKLNGISDGANRTTVDTGMSDTSTNPVQNKAVKSYVDGRTTLDTAMSDNSTKAVQNKVVKSYVDRRTTFDSAMSDTSTNAVQNKIVKSYIDGRTTLDTAMSDTSTKAVQNKVVKSYVDGKFKQKLLAQMPGDGKTSYCQLCTIKISKNYVNRPIEITVQERGRATLDRLTVLFNSVNNNDPSLASFKVFGECGNWYISKRAASTWVIYGQKNESWSDIRVVDYIGIDGVNVTWDVTGVTALPDSKTGAAWGGNVGHAVSADSANSVAWNNVSGKPSTYTPSSHTHTKSQITDFPSSLPANGGNASTVNGHTVNSNVPANAKFTDTNTWRPIGTTADTACAGNDSRLSNARPASDVYAWAKASNKPSYSWSEITSKPSTFTPASHTHNYAGSSSAGGSANSAVKLDTATAGSATQPVYFSGGKPVACSYTLGKSVPSNAVFTDTNTWRGIQDNLTSSSTSDSLSANQGRVLKSLVDGKAASNHTHNYNSIYLRYKTVEVSPKSTVEIWHSGAPNTEKKLILFTAETGYNYYRNIVWFYNGKLYTPDFSSSVGINKTLNNFTCTIPHGIYTVKYNNIETNTSSPSSVAFVKCYNFMGD